MIVYHLKLTVMEVSKKNSQKRKTNSKKKKHKIVVIIILVKPIKIASQLVMILILTLVNQTIYVI